MTAPATSDALRRGVRLEQATLGWNIAGLVVLAVAAVDAHSVALAGFGLDRLIEIGASTVVLWELADSGPERQRRTLRLIGAAFLVLALYLTVQSAAVLLTGFHAHHSGAGGPVLLALTVRIEPAIVLTADRAWAGLGLST